MDNKQNNIYIKIKFSLYIKEEKKQMFLDIQ